MSWIKEHKLQILMGLILALQAVLSVALVIQILRLNMLPGGYLALVILLIALLLAGTLALVLISKKKLVGIIISVVVSIAMLIGCIVIGRVIDTINGISGDIEESNVIAVYVRSDDPAEKLLDTIDYGYAMDEQFDVEDTLNAKAAIEEELEKTIETTKYETVVEMVNGLLKGEVDAIILNTAYIDVLTDIKKYKDLKNDIKSIYEYEIVLEGDSETETEEEKLPVTERPFIVYVSGSDTRNTTLATSRSDVNILAVVNPVTRQILLLNTPRDYYVPISKSGFTQNDKLTHCGIYGIDCSIETLENLYGVDIEFYTQINFTGFSNLVDAVGGITVDNDRSFTSEDGYSYIVGPNMLDGVRALSFVRERHAFKDGDLQRGRNQMRAIKALMDKVKSSPSILTNYSEILASLEGTFVTNVPSTDMSELVKMQLDNGGDWNIVSYEVFGDGKKLTTYTVPNKKAYVMIPFEEDVQKAKDLIQQVYDGKTLVEEN